MASRVLPWASGTVESTVMVAAEALISTSWSWSADDWVRLLAPGHKEFEAAWPGWTDGTVRPYVAAFAYLLGGFTDFHRIGGFNCGSRPAKAATNSSFVSRTISTSTLMWPDHTERTWGWAGTWARDQRIACSASVAWSR